MEGDKDYFRDSFKYFKTNRSGKVFIDSADFDLRNFATLLPDSVAWSGVCSSCEVCAELGLTAHQRWRIFSLKDLDGAFLILNPFTAEGQQRWIKKCLEEYPRKSSCTNLDSQLQGDIWSLRMDRKMVDKLSWATLGYHHNWDTKVYDPSNHSVFPPCLSRLMRHMALCLGFETFRPEAAIVNYYNRKSCLGIHNDHSEEELTQPLLSVSFGLSAIFLVGTDCRTDKPVPLLLESGDIVVLSGPSRLSYHAVPAIVEGSLCLDAGDPVWEPYHQYMLTHRINVSVRQVYSTERV